VVFTSWRPRCGDSLRAFRALGRRSRSKAPGPAIAHFPPRLIMDRQRLRNVIGRKLDNGRLPTNAPIELGVHRGTGAMCDACGRRIHATDIEHEFNYHDAHPFRLPFNCAAEWMAVRRERGL
jgi:hypothetical protein